MLHRSQHADASQYTALSAGIATFVCVVAALISNGCDNPTTPTGIAGPALTIDSIVPSVACRGSQIEIYVRGFKSNISSLRVQFTKSAGVFADVGATYSCKQCNPPFIVVLVPEFAHRGPIRVQDVSGAFADSRVPFEVYDGAVAVVRDIQPRVGAIGSRVRITGAHFLGMRDSVFVRFGQARAIIDSIDSGRIVVRVPEGATSGEVSVTMMNDSVHTPLFTLIPQTINSVHPLSGTPGAHVTVCTNFVPDSSVRVFVGGGTATVVARSDSSVVVQLGSGTRSGKVLLLYQHRSVNGGSFAVTDPMISRIVPESGYRGTSVLLSTNFIPDSSTYVQLGDRPCIVKSRTDSSVSVVVPAGALSGHFSVQYGFGGATSSTLYSVVPRSHTVTGWAPNIGWPGRVVTVKGTQFRADTSSISVTFGGVAGKVVSANDSQLVVVIPKGATTGLIGVSIVGETASSSAPFQITASPKFSTCVVEVGGVITAFEHMTISFGCSSSNAYTDTSAIGFAVEQCGAVQFTGDPSNDTAMFTSSSTSNYGTQNSQSSTTCNASYRVVIDTVAFMIRDVNAGGSTSSSFQWTDGIHGGGGSSDRNSGIHAINLPVTVQPDGSWVAQVTGDQVTSVLASLSYFEYVCQGSDPGDHQGKYLRARRVVGAWPTAFVRVTLKAY
jgi:hypothetical protein